MSIVDDTHDELLAGLELLKLNLCTAEAKLHAPDKTSIKKCEQASKDMLKIAGQAQHYINLGRGKS